MNQSTRALFLASVTLGIVALVFAWMGLAYGARMALEAACYAVIALGLTIQWGYAGLFNAGIMGFIAIAGFTTVLVSFPVNPAFLALGGPALFAPALAVLCAGAAAAILVSRLSGAFLTGRIRTVLMIAVGFATLAGFQTTIGPAIGVLESHKEWVGGLGLPVGIGWLAGGLTAGFVGWIVGRITLGLRADYLAIATLGIAEIIVAFLKNADWLTRGTVTVSPLPWPVPPPQELGFVVSRILYLGVALVAIAVVFLLLERLWSSPWGRMMRAIRDNEIAAAAVGKDVNRRRLEILMLGNVIVGLGGAMLITSNRIFDPTSFAALNHTFLIWVMVILGGAGNNFGAELGAVLVYVIWTMAEPATLIVLQALAGWAEQTIGWQAPADLPTRALQMRVFLIGLTIVVVLRIAPKGLLPENAVRHE